MLVDDEIRIREMIIEYAEGQGFEIHEAGEGFEALEKFKQENYDLILLDVMMPKMDGWSVCREIRRTSKVPIIMLTARGEEYDKLFGFELGVDDYIVKPFSPKELIARMKAVLRRSGCSDSIKEKQNRFQYEGLVVDFDSRNVTVDQSQVTMTPKEYELLRFFVENPNKAFSREQILNSVWGYDFFGDHRTVDTHVKMLRETLKEYRQYIVTVWGTGYKFEIGGKK